MLAVYMEVCGLVFLPFLSFLSSCLFLSLVLGVVFWLTWFIESDSRFYLLDEDEDE